MIVCVSSLGWAQLVTHAAAGKGWLTRTAQLHSLVCRLAGSREPRLGRLILALRGLSLQQTQRWLLPVVVLGFQKATRTNPSAQAVLLPHWHVPQTEPGGGEINSPSQWEDLNIICGLFFFLQYTTRGILDRSFWDYCRLHGIRPSNPLTWDVSPCT